MIDFYKRTIAIDQRRIKLKDYKLYDAEYKLMEVIWDKEPINSTKLKNLCEELFGWKKSTTYSIVKRLKNKGILKNENATITSLITCDEVNKYEIETLLEKNFKGSVPSFVATFLKNKKLSKDEVDEIMKIIEEAKNE